MNNINSKYINNISISNRLNQFKKKHKKQAIIATTIWIALVVGLTVIIFNFLQLDEFFGRNLIFSFVFATCIVSWIYFIPFLGILAVISFRTKNRNFTYQLVVYTGFLIILTAVAIINTIEFKEDLITVIFIIILLIIIALESFILKFVLDDIKKNKQPLFLWSIFQDSFETYSSSILTQQAMLIQEEQDGFSQRPFFTNFSEIEKYSDTFNDFLNKVHQYIEFLSKKNELIGWEIKNDVIILYPRVLMGNPDLGLGIKYFWKLLVKIIKKDELTAVHINYSLKELSLRISKEDYHLLNEVTYHLLGQIVIGRFKRSIISFLENDLDKSYAILFPLNS